MFAANKYGADHELTLVAANWFHAGNDAFVKYFDILIGKKTISNVCNNTEGFSDPCPLPNDVPNCLTDERPPTVNVPNLLTGGAVRIASLSGLIPLAVAAVICVLFV